MPDVIRAFGHPDSDCFMIRIRPIKQAEVYSCTIFRINGEIHALSGPCCTQRIGCSGPYPHFVHTVGNPYRGSVFCRTRTARGSQFVGPTEVEFSDPLFFLCADGVVLIPQCCASISEEAKCAISLFFVFADSAAGWRDEEASTNHVDERRYWTRPRWRGINQSV